MDLFERQWASYRAIVNHNLMEHREVADATAAAIEAWLAARSAMRPAPRMLDLGCGDLALLPPLLRRLPLASYTGLDLTAAVLPLAARALGPVPYSTEWREGELLAWALAEGSPQATTSYPPGAATGIDAALETRRLQTSPAEQARSQPAASRPAASQPPTPGQPTAASADPGPEIGPYPDTPIDILHAAFAIHHLTDDQKATFLAAARRRISSDGLFVWVDVFREPGESREAYVQRYSQRIRGGWGALDAVQREHVIDHLASFDIPAEREAIEAIAEEAGWHWRWAWQGAHRAEAVAVLTPA